MRGMQWVGPVLGRMTAAAVAVVLAVTMAPGAAAGTATKTLAGAGPGAVGSAPALPGPEGKILPPFGVSSESAQSWILWQPPAGLAAPGEWVDFEVEVRGDGVPVFTETFAARLPAGDGGGVISLLHRFDAERETLRELAVYGGIEVLVRAGGTELDRADLRDLAAGPGPGTELLDLRFARQQDAADTADTTDTAEAPLFESVTASETVCEPEYVECFETCRAQYNSCIRWSCFPQLSCSTCDNNYDACRAFCEDQHCVCEPTVRVEVRETDSVSVYPAECLFNLSGAERFFIPYVHTLCTTTVEVTHHCDGTVTEQVLSSSCSTKTCWTETSHACNTAFYWAPLTC